jgi:hypothetical protein
MDNTKTDTSFLKTVKSSSLEQKKLKDIDLITNKYLEIKNKINNLWNNLY